MRDFNKARLYKKQPKIKRKLFGWLFMVGMICGFMVIFFNRGQKQIVSSTSTYSENTTATSSSERKSSGFFPTRVFNLSPLLAPQKHVLVSQQTSEDVVRKVGLLTSDKQGKYGWYVEQLPEGEKYGSNIDTVFTAASVNKVPIIVNLLLEIETGKMSLSDTYTLSNIDIEGGTGGLQYQRLGTVYSYEELLSVMGKNSDNTAANAIARIIGVPNIQSFLDDQQMLETNMEKNTTSPEDMGSLFADIYRDKIFSQNSSKQHFYDALSHTSFEDRIPAGVPNNVLVIHKIGNQIQTLNDCGIVLGPQPYVLCILTDGVAEDEATEVLPQISREVWNFEKDRQR